MATSRRSIRGSSVGEAGGWRNTRSSSQLAVSSPRADKTITVNGKPKKLADVGLVQALKVSDRSEITRWQGDVAKDMLGWSLDTAIDLNGDGLRDMTIASPYVDKVEAVGNKTKVTKDVGAAYLYSGKFIGF